MASAASARPRSWIPSRPAAVERPDLDLDEITSQHVIAELTRLYLADVHDPLTRRALDAASVIRRTTRSLLKAMLPDMEATEAFERLRGLPFVESGHDGLIVHDVVQQVIVTSLQAADPRTYRILRRAAWRQLREEVQHATPSESWRYTADALYLAENPIVREAFFPSDAQPLAVEPALADDGEAIRAITQRYDGPQAAACIDHWWQHSRESFKAIRGRDGVVIGYYLMFDPDTIEPSLLDADPIIQQWGAHVQRNSVPEQQRVLFCRRWLDADASEHPSAVQAACWLDIKGSYMEMRANLRRIYVTARAADRYLPILAKLGFSALADATVEIDGQVYYSAALDFGPSLFNGWLNGIVDAEIREEGPELLDVDAHELVVDGDRVRLTPLEFSVMHYLCEREGTVVKRDDMLTDVWGYEYTGGSNVVDAMIRSLRKKLGDQAAVIETVTGVGYRYRQNR